MDLLWLIPVLPALGALINGIRAVASPHATKNKLVTNAVALGSTALSAVIATIAVLGYHGPAPAEVVYYDWIPAGFGEVAGNLLGNFHVELGFQLDPLSCTMLMIVTWVGFLIHVYATGYMSHEHGYTRFFAYLNLFMFMMLLLVLGNNYLVMFVGWEGVGLCSYLLIGFYYDKNFAADAGKKAFIMNRIGDFGFILGVFLIFNTFGTSDFTSVFALAASDPARFTHAATVIALLLFVGACGKSAQIPLYTWLPDAMAGPTPVSALIHAATMVTAGVYMVVRSNVLFRIAPEAMLVVAVVGAVTALFAATIGVAQNDIKKVLAYSTVSQLGFMFLAAGVGAFTAAIFHVMTHAFFKACLFLGSGAVIHGCSGEQDMRKMGGLKRFMPTTRKTMLVATFAIAGFPPFLVSGFYSKDEILNSAFLARFEELGGLAQYVPLLCWIVGLIAATLTAFYMFRLYFMTFEGEYRGASVPETAAAANHHVVSHADDAHGHGGHHGSPHESPVSMTGVLVILAILSVLGGFVGLPLGHSVFFQWLEGVLYPIGGNAYEPLHASFGVEVLLILMATGAAALGIFLAWTYYGKDPSWSRPRAIAARLPAVYRIVSNKYFVDELYDATAVAGTMALSRALAWFDVNIVDGLVNATRHVTLYLFGHGSNLIDKYVVDGAVNGLAYSASKGSALLRRMQSGIVQNYALVMGGGVIFLVAIYMVLKP